MPDLQNITTVKLYTDKPDGNPTYIYAKQLDKNTRYIKAQIYTPEGLVSIPASATVQMNCTLPNDNKIDILSESIEEDGSVLFKLKTQILALVGNVSCDVTIFVPAENDSLSDDGSQQLTTSTFYITVLESNYSDAAISALNESSTLLGLITTVQNMYREIEGGITNVTPTYVLNWDDISTGLSSLQSMYAAHTADSPTTYNAYLAIGNKVLREIAFELRTIPGNTIAAFSFADLTSRDDGSSPTYEVTLNMTTSTIATKVLSSSIANYTFWWYRISNTGDEIPDNIKAHNIEIYNLLTNSTKPYIANMSENGSGTDSKYRIPLLRVSDGGKKFTFIEFNATYAGSTIYEFTFNQVGTAITYSQSSTKFTTSNIDSSDPFSLPTSEAVINYIEDQFDNDFDSPSTDKGASSQAIVNYVNNKVDGYLSKFFVDLSPGVDNTETYQKIVETINSGKPVAVILGTEYDHVYVANNIYIDSFYLYIDYTEASRYLEDPLYVINELKISLTNYHQVEKSEYVHVISDEFIETDILRYVPTTTAVASYVSTAVDSILQEKEEVETIGEDAYFFGTRTTESEGEETTEIVKYPVPNGVPVYTISWYGETPTSAQRLEIKEICDEIVAYTEACEINLAIDEEAGIKKIELESLEKDTENSGYKLVFTDSDSAGNAVSYIITYDGTNLTSSIKALIAEEFDINSSAAPSMVATDAYVTGRIEFDKLVFGEKSIRYTENKHPNMANPTSPIPFNVQGMGCDGEYLYLSIRSSHASSHDYPSMLRKIDINTGEVVQYIPYCDSGIHVGHGGDIACRDHKLFFAAGANASEGYFGRSVFVYDDDWDNYYYYTTPGDAPKYSAQEYTCYIDSNANHFHKLYPQQVIEITNDIFGFSGYAESVGGLFDKAGNQISYGDTTIGTVAYDNINDWFIFGLNNDVGTDSREKVAYKMYDENGVPRRLYAFAKYTPGQLGALGTFSHVKTIGCIDEDMPLISQGTDADGKYIYQAMSAYSANPDDYIVVYDYDGHYIDKIHTASFGELEGVARYGDNLYLNYAGGRTVGETRADIVIDKIPLTIKTLPLYKTYENTDKRIDRFMGKRFLCVGDGLTQNQYKANSNWTGYLQEWIRPQEIINDGFAGTGIMKSNGGTQGYYARSNNYPEEWSHSVDYVLIMGNIEDYRGGIFTEQTLGEYGDDTTGTQYGAVKVYLESLINKFPTAKFGWIVSPPRYYSGVTGEYLYGKESVFENAVTAIKDVCGGKSIPVLDLYHESGLMPWISENNTEYFTTDIENNPTADGVHPNSKGQELLSRKIYDFVVKNF